MLFGFGLAGAPGAPAMGLAGVDVKLVVCFAASGLVALGLLLLDFSGLRGPEDSVKDDLPRCSVKSSLTLRGESRLVFSFFDASESESGATASSSVGCIDDVMILSRSSSVGERQAYDRTSNTVRRGTKN